MKEGDVEKTADAVRALADAHNELASELEKRVDEIQELKNKIRELDRESCDLLGTVTDLEQENARLKALVGPGAVTLLKIEDSGKEGGL